VLSALCGLKLKSAYFRAMAIHDDTIVALATAQGVSAIAVIRLSGKDCIQITSRVFRGKDLSTQPTHTAHFGSIVDREKTIDDVVITVFREPTSFTKENSAEISCHGSPVIVKEIIKALLKHGARLALPGEFTKRAFLNGRFDLPQAEAVADLIMAETENAKQAAINQMRGGFSNQIRSLREELIHFASLVELELDFGEEDVEFAKRDDLKKLVNKILSVVDKLIESFDRGNVIKNGIPVVIVGKPNAGKSTLLNTLLNEEKAIVSEIPGTTRDFIEDEVVWNGVAYRFVDTAGLRETQDVIESMGVQRTREQMSKAALIVYLFDLQKSTLEEVKGQVADLEKMGIPYLLVGNKVDEAFTSNDWQREVGNVLTISALKKTNIDQLKEKIASMFEVANVKQGDVVITNLRHYQQLVQTRDSLNRVLIAIGAGTTGDFIAMDIRQALHYLGEISGEITSEDLLANIFGKFCIGK
jgi:tRNA modification GTPase